jgi:hypothetical protein
MLKSVFKISIAFFIFTSCQESTSQDIKPQSLVHEGMSATELRAVLGEPKEINTKNEIFDAQSMTKMSLEQWVYEKRTVLLINDTVKNPNLN